MHPQSVAAARSLFYDTRKALARVRGVDVGIASPLVFLAELRDLATGKRLRLAAQNVFWEKLGPRTGEVSAPMLKSIGVKYVIVGHSEQRALGETDEEVQKKVQAVLKEDLVAVVCVGEDKRDAHGNYLSLVEKQLRVAVQGVPKNKLNRLAITYEPVWAISTKKKGHVATPHDAHEMKLFIQKVLADMYGRNAIDKVRILYGGSVNKRNVEDLIRDGEVDGFLVGGASLRAGEFAEIVKVMSTS